MTANAKVDLSRLTINQIKDAYPNGNYKSSMKKADVIKEATRTMPKPETKTSYGRTTEY